MGGWKGMQVEDLRGRGSAHLGSKGSDGGPRWGLGVGEV